jgi:cytochrome b6-f complex iron-sulfur subunit
MGSYEHINLTRRKMIRALGCLALIPLAGLWDVMIKRNEASEKAEMSRILIKDIPQGNSYYDEYWIIRSMDGFKVFSMRCTHLGCRIRPAETGKLICPCHGSSFNPENGTVINGPAEKSLEMINFIIEDDYLTIFIK